jgi:hypothetical protein
MDATLALGHPLEVLDSIRYVNPLAVYPRGVQRLIQKTPGRTNERLALDILAITGLFTNEHHVSRYVALAEDRLSACLPQVAAAAPGGLLPYGFELGANGCGC